MTLTEAQVRRQVADAKIGVAHGNGGVLSSQVTSVWGNDAAL